MPAMIPLPPQDKEKELKKEEEDKKKKADEDSTQTLDQQENMKISGTNARHMVMQKLMRKTEVCFYTCLINSLKLIHGILRYWCTKMYTVKLRYLELDLTVQIV